MADKKEGIMLEYFVPIQSSAELDGDFTINGIAINETTTSNGHKFIGEELSKAANTLIGVPLLKDHNNSVDSIVGRVNVAHWDESLRNIPFSAVVKDTKMKQLIRDKLLSTVSVGAHVKPEDIEETDDGDIIPHNIDFKELSLVAVPADGGATFSTALNSAYKSHSSKIENSTKDERRFNMTEEEKKTESTESEEETKEEPKVETEPEVSDEEKAIDEKIAKLRIAAKKKALAVMEADADEAEEAKDEAKEEVKPEEKEAEETKEVEDEEEEEEVKEKGDYVFTQGHGSIGIQRKSYVYA